MSSFLGRKASSSSSPLSAAVVSTLLLLPVGRARRRRTRLPRSGGKVRAFGEEKEVGEVVAFLWGLSPPLVSPLSK